MNAKLKLHRNNDSETGRILVVDDHRQARESVGDALRLAGHEVHCLSSAIEGLAFLAQQPIDVIITDLNMPGMDGLAFVRELEQRRLGAQVVMVTAYATVSAAVDAMRHGAFDFLEKPFALDRLEGLVAKALERGRLLDRRPALPSSDDPTTATMIGRSPAMCQLRDAIARIAPTHETVLICGESGTGKELVARSVHQQSERVGQPLVMLNCPVLSAQLMESELFGHEKGAFTGADAQRIGRFELADNGTILLDEVTEIELGLQAKLLRVLQERAFERVGSSHTRSVNVRVLATTNRELSTEITAGRFRADLYYRLNVLPLHVPPLRERRSDIPELIDYFLTQSTRRLGHAPCLLDAGAEDLLLHYDWPGNVRELQNVVTRASVLGAGSTVTADQLRPWMIGTSESPTATSDVTVGISLQQMERRMIEATLEHFDGHRAKTAQALGIGLRTLSGKLKEFGYKPRSRTLAASA